MSNQETAVSAEMAQYRRELRVALARELHDGPIQALTGAVIRLEGYRPAASSPGMQSAISEVEKSVRVALTSLRRLIRDLREEAPDEDVAEKVRSMAARFESSTDVEVAVVVSPLWPALLPSAIAVNLIRIVQEAIINAIRHGQAERVLIELKSNEGVLTACVTDDGSGLPSQASPGSGLIGMRERAALLGGGLHIHRLDRGTEIKVEFPLP